MDAWKITDVTAEAFERATGLSAFQYGMKGKESNDRSAAETQARAKHAGVRPEYMQKRHRECEGNIASHEAILSHWFIDGNDVRPLGGATMQWGWERYVMMTQITNVIWGMSYDITASSIRRPDREMEAARWDRALDVLGPNYFSYGMASADFTGWNSLIENWAENMDTMQGDIDSLMIRPPQQEGPSEEEQQQAAMEQAKTEADLQGKQMDLQGKQMDLAGKEMDLQGKVAQSQLDMQGQAAQSMFQQRDMATKTLAEMRKAEIDMAKNSRALEFAQRKQVTDLAGQEANAAIDISHKLALNRIQRARAKAGSNGDERKE